MFKFSARRATVGVLLAATAMSAVGAVPAAAATAAPAGPAPDARCAARPAPPNDRFGTTQKIDNRTGHTLKLVSWHANTEQAPAATIASGGSDTPRFANWQPCEAPQVWIDYDVVDGSGTVLGKVQSYVNVDWIPFSWKATNSASVGQGPFAAQWGNDGQSPASGGNFGAWATFTKKG